MQRTLMPLGLLFLAVSIISGCGGGVEKAKPRQEVPGITGSLTPVAAAQEQATAEEANYQGWKAFRLTNGMVTLVVVPDIGGRIVEYRLGSRSFLWLNPDQVGKTYPLPRNESERVWRNFGGYQVFPGPKRIWDGPPDPVGSELVEGKWDGKITVAKGRHAEVQLFSAKDKLTGLQITRTIKLFGASSQATVSETLTNTGSAEVQVYLQRIALLPTATETGAKISDKFRIYLPLNPDSPNKGGFVALKPEGTDQFKALSKSLLQVTPDGREAQIGVDSLGGWVADVEESQDYAFIQRFQVSKLADYPEQNSTVMISATAKPAVVALTLLTPTKTLAPGETLEASTDWYATRIGGPIIKTTDVAAISQALKVTPKDGKLQLSGALGVFAPGKLAFILQDAQGKAIGQPTILKVSPADMVTINQTVPDEKSARQLVVELQNDNGTPLGSIAQIAVGAAIAKATD